MIIFICPVTLAEIEYGLQTSPNIDNMRQQEVRSRMRQYPVLPIDRHTVYEYARIRAALFRQFSPKDRRGRLEKKYVEDLKETTTGRELEIQENDLWIVSVAVQHDLLFITSDAASGMRRVLDATNYRHRTQIWPLP